MSQQGNFAGGFLLGTLVGGVLGGVIGALTANRLQAEPEDASAFSRLSEDLQRNLADATPEERMELARRGLEDKISQLNAAIEDVRQQMGTVNGHGNQGSDYGQPTMLDS
jgi:hypothetical protein